jgi:hypothetical protein
MRIYSVQCPFSVTKYAARYAKSAGTGSTGEAAFGTPAFDRSRFEGRFDVPTSKSKGIETVKISLLSAQKRLQQTKKQIAL